MFIDEAFIKVKSGKGGDGVVHFRREKYVPRGGPDGGDGGRGGDVILKVSSILNTLNDIRHHKHYRAEDGANGAKQNMTGRSAPNMVLNVPPGTLVYDVDTGQLLGDLTEDGQELVVAVGGRGGRGNARFATSRHQAPKYAEKGEPFSERNLRLELKLIADIGIIGVPNAGKSTFLAAVTNAQPKIASYPFTTLEPNLGVAEIDTDMTLILADIPGLIEGAHLGVGLGHDFLKHIQRTRVLIHLLDGLSEDPISDLDQINSELALFDPGLQNKPQIIVLNKIDIDEVRKNWSQLKKKIMSQSIVKSENLLSISAATGENVREVLNRAALLLSKVKPVEVVEAVPVYRVEADPREFIIEHQNNGWYVRGTAIERAAAMTHWEFDASIRRFQKILNAIGIEDALRKAGVQEGDTVFIGEYELEWSD